MCKTQQNNLTRLVLYRPQHQQTKWVRECFYSSITSMKREGGIIGFIPMISTLKNKNLCEYNVRNKCENKPQHLLYFPENICPVKIFSNFPFCPLSVPSGKYTLQLVLLCKSAAPKQKVGFQNIKTKTGKDFLFQSPCFTN